jgi:hypothetical protein
MMRRWSVWGAGAVMVLALLGPAGAAAQGVAQTYVGVSGGATYGDLYGGAVNTDSRWGGTAGVFVGARTWNYLAFSLEGNWEQKGGGDVRLDYIGVPLTVGGIVMPGGDFRLRAYGGIGVGFKVGCNSGGDVALTCDLAKGTEWNLPFGFMFGRNTGGARFVALDVRYVIGLSDAFEAALPYSRSWQFRAVIGLAGSGK